MLNRDLKAEYLFVTSVFIYFMILECYICIFQLGGLLGGLVTSWLLGPAWKYESLSNDGRRVFADRAPIFHLVNRRRKP